MAARRGRSRTRTSVPGSGFPGASRCCATRRSTRARRSPRPSATRWACAACCRRTCCRRRSRSTRVLENFRRKPNDLEKFINLAALHDRNETLFFRIVIDHPDEMMPIIYTPTVGLACQQFGHIFQRPRGLFISANDRGRIANILRNWPYRDVAIIVVTDGERILGLGDLGANGMGIPVGKLALYTACAGVHPTPVPAGHARRRHQQRDAARRPALHRPARRSAMRGAAYDELVDEFIAATQEVFPGVVVQFEDFANHNAFRLLEKYRDRICTFNDDIQGTAAVALAGICSALRVTGGKLADQTDPVPRRRRGGHRHRRPDGGGDGRRRLRAAATRASAAGSSIRKGLVVDEPQPTSSAHKLPYAHEHAPIADFPTAVRALKPTAIIGVAAVGGTFTPGGAAGDGADQRAADRVRAVEPDVASRSARRRRRTAGPTAARCSPAAARSTRSRIDGRTHVPRQGNNSYIFPGVGLAAIATRAHAGHRRDVHGRGARAGRAGRRRRPRAGQPLPAAAAGARGLGAHRRRGRARSSTRRATPAVPRPAGPARVHALADVRPALRELRQPLTEGPAAPSFDLRQARAAEAH